MEYVWGVDSVKSTVTVLEEGDFTEEGGGFNWRGCFSVGGYHYLWRRGALLISRRGSSSSGVGGHSSLEEGCVLISRRGSSSSGVGGHTSLEEGCILIARRGSYFRWTRGTF